MNISASQIMTWIDQFEQFLFARWVCIVCSNGLVALCGYLALQIKWHWFVLFDPIHDGINKLLAFGQGTMLGLMVGMATGFLTGLVFGVIALLGAINEKNIR